MGRLAGLLQAAGALAFGVGLFLVLAPGLALAIVGALTVAGGVVLEVGRRPRVVPAPDPLANGTIPHAWLRGPRPSDMSER